MRRKSKYIKITSLLITSILYLGLGSLLFARDGAEEDKFFYVTRVIDGDTLKLSSGQKVRLIGIDTPEMYYSDKLLRDAKRSKKDIRTIQGLGRRSSAFTRELCHEKKVRLEFDIEKRDRYGRWLAYVYLEDGTFVNAKILEEGYGQVMTIPPNVKYADYFLKLQKEARTSNKGLWEEESVVLDKPTTR